MAAVDFNLICRLCVQFFEKEKVSPIFNNETYSDKISLPERIRYCSDVEVNEDDGLPPQICNTCLSKLNQSFVFRNQCVLADITLKRLKSVSFSVNEMPILLKVDNEIIQPEKYDLGNIDAENLKNQFKNDYKIDEFDNSKNGRHKRSIHKLKSIPLQKTKILIKETEIEWKSDLPGESKNKLKNLALSRELTRLKETKSESNAELTNSETCNNAKKSRKSKQEKQLKVAKDLQEDFQTEANIHKHADQSTDVNSFSDITENFQSDSSPSKINKDSNKNVPKSKLKTKRQKGMKISSAKQKPTSYKCDHCQKIYPSEGGWRYHIHTMHNENYQPFICDLCGQTFRVKKNLEVHKNSIHFHLKLHLCDLCGRGFASKYALKVHKIWHNDEKNFTCDVCGTKFRTRGKMNTHRSIHGGPKNFMCHICPRDFRWKKDFDIHMRTHTGEKPFKCSHCGKAFASLTNMKKHEKNHLKKLETDDVAEKVDDFAV